MRIVEVSGSAEDMGRAQGAAMADKMKGVLDLLADHEPPRGLEDLVGKHCPRQLVRMIGIARGAGVTLEAVLAAAVAEIQLAQVHYYLGGCTAFALRDKKLSHGGPIIGKNFDYNPGLEVLNIARISRPEDAFSSIDVTSGPLSGTHEGVNEKGLAIAYNYAYAIDKPSAPLPLTMLVQETLERFETTESAINFLVDLPRGDSALMMIVDRSGDIAGLELSPHYSGVRRPDGDFIGHTNHYHTPQMVAIDIPRDAYYSDKMPEPLQDERIRESSEIRYARMLKLLESKDGFNFNEIVSILKDHGVGESPSDNTICRHGAYYKTTISLLLNTAPPSLKIAWGNPCRNEFEEVEL